MGKDCDPELALSVGANWDGAQTVGPVLQAATFLTGGNDPTGGSAVGRNESGRSPHAHGRSELPGVGTTRSGHDTRDAARAKSQENVELFAAP